MEWLKNQMLYVIDRYFLLLLLFFCFFSAKNIALAGVKVGFCMERIAFHREEFQLIF